MYCFNVKVSSICFGIDEKGIEPIHFMSDAEIISVRELITRTVKIQIDTLQKEQSISIEEAKKILNRQYLSNEEISSMAQKGSISLTGKSYRDIFFLDINSEIERALEAFRKSNFFITVDGYQPQKLKDKIVLMENTEVFFLRLMPLVGG